MHLQVAPAQAPTWSNLCRPPGRTEGASTGHSDQANGRPDVSGGGATGPSSIPPGTNASACTVVSKLTVTHDLEGAPRLALFVGGEMESHGAGGGWSEVFSDLKTLLETGRGMRE